jgi:hypothetical protein
MPCSAHLIYAPLDLTRDSKAVLDLQQKERLIGGDLHIIKGRRTHIVDNNRLLGILACCG